MLSDGALRAAPLLLLLALASTVRADDAGGGSWLQKWLDPSTAPFIPVPEVDVDPVGGVTLGLIPVFLTLNEHDQIERIIAPDIIHSQYFGWGARGRIFDYPSTDTQWTVVGGGKQRVEREFDALYQKGLERSDTWSWTLHASFNRSGTSRFFGIGNDTPLSAETNYVDNQGRLEGTGGLNLSRKWQASYAVRVGFEQIGTAVLPQMPSIETRFPTLPGIDREEEFQQRLQLTYDSRDSITIPHSGELVTGFAGVSDASIWGTVSYSFVGFDARMYRQVEPWLTIAAHAALRYMPSSDHAPFWALSSIGGVDSIVGDRQPLRAFGQDRFIDRNSFAAGTEFRARVAQFRVFATDLSLEATPFIDLGKVYSDGGESPLIHLHKAFGVGMRGVAAPYIVGFVDAGFGPEGAAVFTGINYPF